MVTKIVHIPAVIALILCVVGATNASDPTKIESQSTIHIGIILFAVVWGMLVALTFGAWYAKRRSGEGEGLLILAVLCALPFLAVKLVYSILPAFTHSKIFGLNAHSTDAETAALFMSVLVEMFVVLIYITTGLKLRAVPKGAADPPGCELAYRAGRGDFGTGKLGILSLGIAAFGAMKPKHEQQASMPECETRRHDEMGLRLSRR